MEINTKYYLEVNNYSRTTLNRSEGTKSNPFSIPFEHYSQTGVDENLLFNSQPSLLNTYKADDTFISDQRYTSFFGPYFYYSKESTIIDQYKKDELKHLEIPEIVATLYKGLYQFLSDEEKSLPEVKEIEKNINLLLEEYNNTNKNKNTTSIKLKIEYELFKLKRIADANRENLNPFLAIFDGRGNFNYTLSQINTNTIGDFLNFSADLNETFRNWWNMSRSFDLHKDEPKILEHISKVLLKKAKDSGIKTREIEKQIKTEIKRYRKALNSRNTASMDKLNELFRELYSQIAEKEGLEPLQNYKYLTCMHEHLKPLYKADTRNLMDILKYRDKYDEKFIEEMFIYFKNNYPNHIDEINKIEKVVKTYLMKYKNNDGDKTEIDAIICFEVLKLRNIGETYKESPLFAMIDNRGIEYTLPCINNHTIENFLNLSNDMDLTLSTLFPYDKDYTILFDKIKTILINMANEAGIDTTDISKQIEEAISEYKSGIDPNNTENKPTTNKINKLFRTLYSQIAQKENLPQLTDTKYNNLIPAIADELDTEPLFDVLDKYTDINNEEEVKDLLLKIFDYATNNNKDIKDLRESYILVIEKIIAALVICAPGGTARINSYKEDLFNIIRRTWDRKIVTNAQNKKIDQNGLIDRDFEQGNVGSCWLLSSIKSLASNSQTAQMLNANITIDEEGNTHVKLLGPNKTYIVTREELLSHSDYSMGDYDIRAIEIAVNKYLLEERKEDVDGGTQFDAMNILLGNSITTITTDGDRNLLEIENNKFEKALNEKIIEKLPELIKNKNLVWGLALNLNASKNIEGEIIGENRSTTLITRHGYGVVDIDKDYIYISNPHDSKKTIKVLLKDIIDGGGTLTISEPKDSNILKGIVLEVLSEYINGQIEKLKDDYIMYYNFEQYYKEISLLANFINKSDINDEQKEELKTLLLNYFSQFLIDNEYLMNYTTYNEDSRADFKDIVTKLRQFVTENFNGDKKLMDQIDKILFSSISIKKYHDRVNDIYSMSSVTEILNKQAIIIDETFPENTTIKITAKQEIIDIYIKQIKEAKEYYYYCKKMGCHIDAVKDFEALCSSATKFLEDNKDIKELKTFELSSLLTLINPPDYTEEEQQIKLEQADKEFLERTYKGSPFRALMNF